MLWRAVSLFPYRKLLNALYQIAYPTEVQNPFSKKKKRLFLIKDQIINNNNKCSLRRKIHTPIYSFLCFTLKEALIFLYISRHPAHFRDGVLTFSLWTRAILILSPATVSRRNKALTQILQIRLNCRSDVTLWHTVSCELSQMYKHLMTNPFRYFNAQMKIYWRERESICDFPLEPACGRRIEQIGFF